MSAVSWDALGDEPVRPRPPELLEAVRLANLALEQLVAAIEATDDEDLELQFNEAADELEEAIGVMTAVPEVGYGGQRFRRGQS